MAVVAAVALQAAVETAAVVVAVSVTVVFVADAVLALAGVASEVLRVVPVPLTFLQFYCH